MEKISSVHLAEHTWRGRGWGQSVVEATACRDNLESLLKIHVI